MKKIIAATYAPMNAHKDLNLDIIGKYGRFLKDNGVMEVFVNGSTGDFVSLSLEERKRLIEAWTLDKPKAFKLINHVGHNNLREARELAEHSRGKADAIAALPPYYFRLKSLDRLVEYCREIAGAAPELPFYYYHIPVLTGATFRMIDFLELLEGSIENFAGIKYTYNDLDDYKMCRQYRSEYEILFGVDEEMFSSLSYGAGGWVGSTYNHLAPLYHQIIDFFDKGDIQRAEELQGLARLFVETLDKFGGFNGAGKSFMRLFGLNMGPSRFPHITLTDNDLKQALELFENKGLTPYFSKPFIPFTQAKI